MFFTLSSWQLALVLAGILFGATAIGLLAAATSGGTLRPCASRSASSRPRS